MNLTYAPYLLDGLHGLGVLRTSNVLATRSPSSGSTSRRGTTAPSRQVVASPEIKSSVQINPITTRSSVPVQQQSVASRNIISNPTQSRGNGISVPQNSIVLQNLISQIRNPGQSTQPQSSEPQIIQTSTGKKILVRPIVNRSEVVQKKQSTAAQELVKKVAEAKSVQSDYYTNDVSVIPTNSDGGITPSSSGGSGGGGGSVEAGFPGSGIFTSVTESLATGVQQLIPGTTPVAAKNIVKTALVGIGLIAFVYMTRPKKNEKS